MGVGKDGSRKENFQHGVELKGKYNLATYDTFFLFLLLKFFLHYCSVRERESCPCMIKFKYCICFNLLTICYIVLNVLRIICRTSYSPCRGLSRIIIRGMFIVVSSSSSSGMLPIVCLINWKWSSQFSYAASNWEIQIEGERKWPTSDLCFRN